MRNVRFGISFYPKKPRKWSIVIKPLENYDPNAGDVSNLIQSPATSTTSEQIQPLMTNDLSQNSNSEQIWYKFLSQTAKKP